MDDLIASEPHRRTMERLEAAKRTTATGAEYWLARELGPILGYPRWGNFEPAIQRAKDALKASGRDPSHHILQVQKMMGVGRGGQVGGRDYFLSRGASYLITMNGDPAKPEVATAQIYFAAKTRQMEQVEQAASLTADEKRLELREKVSGAAKRVSSAAKDAGVRNHRQGIFHEQRYKGLYGGASSAQVKAAKGLKPSDNLFDRADHLELSAHDFQMNLAANALANENVRGEQNAFDKNLQIAQGVRRTIQQNGGVLPERLPLAADHIGDVRKRLTGKKARALTGPKKNSTV